MTIPPRVWTLSDVLARHIVICGNRIGAADSIYKRAGEGGKTTGIESEKTRETVEKFLRWQRVTRGASRAANEDASKRWQPSTHTLVVYCAYAIAQYNRDKSTTIIVVNIMHTVSLQKLVCDMYPKH